MQYLVVAGHPAGSNAGSSCGLAEALGRSAKRCAAVFSSLRAMRPARLGSPQPHRAGRFSAERAAVTPVEPSRPKTHHPSQAVGRSEARIHGQRFPLLARGKHGSRDAVWEHAFRDVAGTERWCARGCAAGKRKRPWPGGSGDRQAAWSPCEIPGISGSSTCDRS